MSAARIAEWLIGLALVACAAFAWDAAGVLLASGGVVMLVDALRADEER